MDKSTRNILIVVGVLVVGGIFAFLIFLSGPSDKFRWSQDYRYNNDQPYGGMVLASLLKETVGSKHFTIVEDSLPGEINMDELTSDASYVYIGEDLYVDSTDLDFILRFVEQGNNAFIISESFRHNLLDTLLEDGDYDYYEYNNGDLSDFLEWNVDTIARLDLEYVNFNPDSLAVCKYLYEHKTQDHYWRSFLPDILGENFDDPDGYGKEVDYLGYYNEYHLNYIRVEYGEGSFYLHCTPLAFSNYYLLEQDNFEYVREVFADLNTENVFWDESNRYWEYVPGEFEDNQDSKPDDGPLVFIFSQPGLKWAWFLSLLGVFAYLILGMRRKQRIIPVLEPNDNTSIEYSETLSQLYIQQRDHRKLCMLKMTLFMAFIRERYGLRTNMQSDKDQRKKLIQRISIKSNIPQEQVESIFTKSDKLRVIYEVKNNELVEFHDQLEDFYKNCK
jgi:hypothetical protein